MLPLSRSANPHRAYLLAVLVVLVAAGCGKVNDLFCADEAGCFFTEGEWAQVKKLSPLPAAPRPDPSNRFVGNPDAVDLGWRLYFDCDLSGNSTWVDTLERTTSSARSELGRPTRLSCASCHNPAHAGTDTSSNPGNVSVGAGWYDVNGQQTVNAAYYRLIYWNGRADSLWSQAAAVMESKISMNGNRLAILWTVAKNYRAAYQLVVGQELPLPSQPADCGALTAAACAAAPGCVVALDQTDPSQPAPFCLAQYPASGKPSDDGACLMRRVASNAYDCLDAETRSAIDTAYTNVAKIIAAYEYELHSRDALFDQFVAGRAGAMRAPDLAGDPDAGAGAGSGAAPDAAPIAYPPAALRGLKLFVSRASCIDCHNTPLFSDQKFHNIGVPQEGQGVPTESDCPGGSATCDCVSGEKCLPWGYYDGLRKLTSAKNRFSRKGSFSDDPLKDLADYPEELEAPSTDVGVTRLQKGAWRTPSLRDVALTAPYMHDGVYRTLDEVVWHYNEGGFAPVGGDKAPELNPLLLSDRDRSDLVAFLQTLTGKPDRPELHLPPPRYSQMCVGWTP
jgi:cytochrome c peroxidase